MIYEDIVRRSGWSPGYRESGGNLLKWCVRVVTHPATFSVYVRPGQPIFSIDLSPPHRCPPHQRHAPRCRPSLYYIRSCGHHLPNLVLPLPPGSRLLHHPNLATQTHPLLSFLAVSQVIALYLAAGKVSGRLSFGSCRDEM